MTLFLMGAGGEEPETVLRIKMWYVIAMVISAIVFLFIQHSGHEARLCVAEKQQQVEAAERNEIKITVEKMYREQDLYFSLREPRWKEWKKWAEKQQENGK